MQILLRDPVGSSKTMLHLHRVEMFMSRSLIIDIFMHAII